MLKTSTTQYRGVVDPNGHSRECNVACRAHDAAMDDANEDEREAYDDIERAKRLLRIAQDNCPACAPTPHARR